MNFVMPFSSIPLDVPKHMKEEFAKNYAALTKNNRIFLFTCDHKIEHLNDDFYGPDIHSDALNPHHLFALAQNPNIGALATQLGLVSRYGSLSPKINYVIKINSKTHLIPTSNNDPRSPLLWDIETVVEFKKTSGLPIRGIGYTLYLGSKYEPLMMREAATVLYQGHQHGLVTFLWVYSRGRYLKQTSDLVAGATGVATALGADFVKIKAPEKAEQLRIASITAGNTKIICSGNKLTDAFTIITNTYDQIQMGNTDGIAMGRNLFQRSKQDCTALINALALVIFENTTAQIAYDLYLSQKA